MEIYSYPQLNEQIQAAVLPNGLRIYCVPRADSEKTFAMLAADFGSIDCHFTIDGQTHDVTPGIAHFLEHKLFEEQDGNALQKFAARGAHPNAFTSHIMTAYHFTCTDRFYEDLEILLRFVTTPYFTDENVAKEKGIIGQEIDMLEDTPGWSAYVGVLQALYAVHPVRISVAGSKQSIAPIDPDVLRLCHRGFYSPKNLVLVVCGQYAFDRVVELAQRITPAEAAEIASRTYGVEPEAVAQPRWERKMAVSRSDVYGWLQRSGTARHVSAATRGRAGRRSASEASLPCCMIHYISAGWQIGRLIRITLRLRAARVRCSAARAASQTQCARRWSRKYSALRRKAWTKRCSAEAKRRCMENISAAAAMRAACAGCRQKRYFQAPWRLTLQRFSRTSQSRKWMRACRRGRSRKSNGNGGHCTADGGIAHAASCFISGLGTGISSVKYCISYCIQADLLVWYSYYVRCDSGGRVCLQTMQCLWHQAGRHV